MTEPEPPTPGTPSPWASPDPAFDGPAWPSASNPALPAEYPPAAEYPPPPGHAPPGGYPTSSEYPPSAGFPPPPGYAPPGGYQPPPGYAPPAVATDPGHDGDRASDAASASVPRPHRREPWVEPGDLRAAAVVVGLLAVIGVVAGVFWGLRSPHATGIVVTRTEIGPLEQENWIAADGRFVIITAIIGLVAGVLAWLWRSRRGPVLAAGVAAGAAVGALLTALVGYWLSSGHTTGRVNTEIRLRVSVHAHGLIAVEAVLAVGAYLTGVLFSGPDDLGRSAAEPLASGDPAIPPGGAGYSGPAYSGPAYTGPAYTGPTDDGPSNQVS